MNYTQYQQHVLYHEATFHVNAIYVGKKSPINFPGFQTIGVGVFESVSRCPAFSTFFINPQSVLSSQIYEECSDRRGPPYEAIYVYLECIPLIIPLMYTFDVHL